MDEKKLALCIILVIAFGVATVVPLGYLIPAQANATKNVQTLVTNPLFNVNATYVNFNLNFTGGTPASPIYGAYITGLLHITLLNSTLQSIQNYDAKIEYYQFRVYSNQGPIVNLTYCVGYANNTTIIAGNGTIGFTNGLTYTGTPVNAGLAVGNGLSSIAVTPGFLNDMITNSDFNNPPATVAELRNASTLYIDVYRECVLTVKGDTAVKTPENSQVLQHIILTKTSTGFTYGSYKPTTATSPGTAPIPPQVMTG